MTCPLLLPPTAEPRRTRFIDRGTWQVTGSRDRVKHVRALVALYQPDVLVFEDTAARGSRRWKRARDLMPKFRTLAVGRRVRFHVIPRRKVEKHFKASGATRKHQIAFKKGVQD